jgi:2-polyprenyl-3-methyl-5-hydroxy-6-metoxy-1,4-benzoquinol methylase
MNPRDYKSAWVLPEGHEYRMAVYERQRAGGTRPLVDNPTVEEIRDALLEHTTIGGTVLEVGCGWGRLLKPLWEKFTITGFDVSAEMREIADPSIRTRIFSVDITQPAICRPLWDAVFCRGVMMFIPPDKLAQAMRNMESMARKKVLVWEWTDVNKAMRKAYRSDKFQYFDIPVRDE